MILLNQAVGIGAKNKPVDVMFVQHLLNLNHEAAGLDAPLPITGEVDTATTDAIKQFQREVLHNTRPDGRVDPGGKLLRKLVTPAGNRDVLTILRSVLSASYMRSPVRPGEFSSALSSIDTQRFMRLYDRQFVQLGGDARAGLEELIGFINADFEIVDVGWCAYMLATVKHECAEKWRPIKEYGLGAGKEYGNPVTVTDSEGKKHKNTYYGRGYVQLTWKKNYRVLGEALGLGDQLLVNPDLALVPTTAYNIMSYGMRNGSFTGKKLSDYIDQNHCDCLGARRIINGIDRHVLIGRYETDIELLLRVSCLGSICNSSF